MDPDEKAKFLRQAHRLTMVLRFRDELKRDPSSSSSVSPVTISSPGNASSRDRLCFRRLAALLLELRAILVVIVLVVGGSEAADAAAQTAVAVSRDAHAVDVRAHSGEWWALC